jgi:AAA family ATP:ADP antiporter
MLTAKAMGYALNQPAKETLYIPTSKNIKYKSKAWIDMFGFRLAKACGSGINEIIGVCVNFSGGIALSMIVVWIFVSRLLGNFFKKTIASKDIIK